MRTLLDAEAVVAGKAASDGRIEVAGPREPAAARWAFGELAPPVEEEAGDASGREHPEELGRHHRFRRFDEDRLDLPATRRAIATACFCGLPWASSVLMLALIAIRLLPFWSGIRLSPTGPAG